MNFLRVCGVNIADFWGSYTKVIFGTHLGANSILIMAIDRLIMAMDITSTQCSNVTYTASGCAVIITEHCRVCRHSRVIHCARIIKQSRSTAFTAIACAPQSCLSVSPSVFLPFSVRVGVLSALRVRRY